MGKCAVPLCPNRDDETKTSGISFHRFPRKASMSKIWASNIGQPDWTPTRQSRICSYHFTTDSYIAGNRLKKIATPTVLIERIEFFDKRRRISVVNPASVEPTVEGDKENPSVTVGLELIIEPSAAVELESINESTLSAGLETNKLPSTTICSGPSTTTPATEKVYIVRGVELMEIDTPRKATLLEVIRKRERKGARKQLQLWSLKRKSITLQKRVSNLKVINKDLRDKFNMSLDTSQMIEGISETSSFLGERQMNKACHKKLSKVYDTKLKAFALTLHFLSPRAYKYVMETFDTCLPPSSFK